MKRVVFIILCILKINFVYSQVTNLGITNRFEGQGKIDKYEINLILDVITHPYYVEGDHVGEIQQFSGKYYYKNYKKDIFLSGTRQILFTQGEPSIADSITLYEFDLNFNKVAVFNGVLSKTSLVGNWVSVKNTKQLPFNIQFDQSKFTLLELITIKGSTILPTNSLGDYFNIYNQNEFDIKKVIIKNERIYVIATLAFTVCGAIKVRGSGCGGHDVFLRLYEIYKGSSNYSEVKVGGFPIFSFEERLDYNKYSFVIKSTENGVISQKGYEVNFEEIGQGIKNINHR